MLILVPLIILLLIIIMIVVVVVVVVIIIIIEYVQPISSSGSSPEGVPKPARRLSGEC